MFSCRFICSGGGPSGVPVPGSPTPSGGGPGGIEKNEVAQRGAVEQPRQPGQIA